MPVFPDTRPTIGDEISRHRRHRHHFNSAGADPNPQLSRTAAKKKSAAAAAFRGLGCTAGAAKQVSVPAMIRSSAEWEGKPVKVKKKKTTNNKSKEVAVTGVGEGGSSGNNNGDGGLNQGGNCMVIQDVWCGPGIGFSPDAVVDSVDCVVVNRRNRIDVAEKFNPRERERERERERPCLSRRAAVDPQAFSLWDADPAAFATLRAESDMSGSRYYRHLRRAPPDGLAEMLMLQNGIVMGGRLDRFNEWRLDIDSMSYEQLLELEDRIGYVSTGLKEDEIGHCIKKYKLSVLSKLPSHIQMSLDKKCSICQEDFEGGDVDEVGKLECGHGFHIQCIKQWLAHKNNCPVCKTAPLPRS